MTAGDKFIPDSLPSTELVSILVHLVYMETMNKLQVYFNYLHSATLGL